MKKHTLVFTIFLLLNQSLSWDPRYEACVAKDCGDGRKVTYPFFINELHDSSCGYPGFELRCSNGSSILRIAENDFIVKDIQYKNSSLRLQDAAILPNQTESCPSKIRNITLDPNRFRIDNVSTTKLILISNCSSVLPVNLKRYRIRSCEESNEVVMLANDMNLRNVTTSCGYGRKVVETLVELSGEEGRSQVVDGDNYPEVVERGFVLHWLAADCGVCESSGGRCGFNQITFGFRCFCRDRPHMVSCRTGTKENLPVIIVTALCIGLGAILVVIMLCFIRKFKRRRSTKSYVNVENFLKNHEFLAKRYSYLQVKKMTNTFEVKVGQGGFGSVYRGVLRNGNLVAVKILSELKGKGEDFINEVASVGKTSHVNIVSLVGFCFEGHKRALIYEFMPNGSLEKFIHDQASSDNIQLGWKKLHEIALGIARGLEYLHIGCNTRILHFDIKPHNILLDQDFSPKISDFGLAKLFPEKRSMISMSHMRGTPGYIAPEVYSRNFGQVSHKSDVYSYGMMILEMVGGRKNIEAEVDHTSEIYFPHWIYKKVEFDEELGLHRSMSNEENEMARKMIIVGLWCIQTNPVNRPTITKALEMLEGDLASLEIPPKPYLSSPSRLGASSITD
ncbi:LEAF RUST 10 DISEASE-RESISTANCE LOCUS RECEPTOR-LIKE PROTEIN KINASE-like 2.1 isoform X1 [Lactuca sativa]|uniref:LEAF RUST 10 DISEASE-RESISTANCE LOCUS RECEPTOR-LIKE PROTEIN KINASE-like 2.1 isoform X1 n=1 Tax=Lactuca sativa TaxID=4236 RepID=UPI000CD7FE5C|nr:LEAF RUST 10 DISEASE-RESISTANCE LOCUS RECEPTOR-LIKE PROTEIN KINASE-like 2.1 isoform X1 [Lactuca sativa]